MAYPNTFQNRTRLQAKEELLEYTGGVSRPEALDRAALCWDAAVREFNTDAWRFNIRTQDITLDGTTVVGGVTGVQDYDLADKFRTPVRCLLLDSNSVTRRRVVWLPYNEWVMLRPDQVTGSNVPSFYTARNVHETGKVSFDPRPLGTLTYPKARMIYATWIDIQTTDASALDVPPDVDEAIFQLAVAKILAKNKRFEESQVAMEAAARLRFIVQRNHRIFGEDTQIGANG